MQDIKFSSAAASADHSAVDPFHAALLSVIDADSHLSKQVFNVDKLGLYWKQMPARSFISLCAALGSCELKVLTQTWMPLPLFRLHGWISRYPQ